MRWYRRIEPAYMVLLEPDPSCVKPRRYPGSSSPLRLEKVRCAVLKFTVFVEGGRRGCPSPPARWCLRQSRARACRNARWAGFLRARRISPCICPPAHAGVVGYMKVKRLKSDFPPVQICCKNATGKTWVETWVDGSRPKVSALNRGWILAVQVVRDHKSRR